MKFKRAGKYLQTIRERAELTQVEVADKLKLHPQFVSNWERGICMPPRSAFKKLATMLGFTKTNRHILKGAIFADLNDEATVRFEGLI